LNPISANSNIDTIFEFINKFSDTLGLPITLLIIFLILTVIYVMPKIVSYGFNIKTKQSQVLEDVVVYIAKSSETYDTLSKSADRLNNELVQMSKEVNEAHSNNEIYLKNLTNYVNELKQLINDGNEKTSNLSSRLDGALDILKNNGRGN